MPDPIGARRLTVGRRADGEEFPLEASISQVEVGTRKLYTIIHRESTQAAKPNLRSSEQTAQS